MLEKSAKEDRDFVHAIFLLRGMGLKTAALTNNFAPMASSDHGSIKVKALEGVFDVVVESAVEGVRKPDPKAFDLVCKRLGVAPNEAAFLDDIGINVKAAKGFGIGVTILVKLANKKQALRDLYSAILERNGNEFVDKTMPMPKSLLFEENPTCALKFDISNKQSNPSNRRILVGDSYGHACDPPVLLLHGGGQTRHAWGGAGKALAQRGYHAFIIDMKGHGDSYWDPDGIYTSWSFSEDVDTLLDVTGLGARGCVVIGASLGGLAALSTSYCQSETCAGVVLVDVTPRLRQDGVNRILDFMAKGQDVGFATLEDAAKAIQAYQPHRVRAEASENNAGSLEGLRKNLRFDEKRERYFFHWDPAFLNRTRTVHLSELKTLEYLLMHCAKNITCPVLLIKGKMTDVVSDEGVEQLRQSVPQARVVELSEAGHMVAGDKNDVFNQSVLDFVGSLTIERERAKL